MASETGYGDNFDDTMRSKIDSRLRRLQLEENLPSVSKSMKQKSEMDEIMDPASFDEMVGSKKAVYDDVNTDEVALEDNEQSPVKQVSLKTQSAKNPPLPPKPAVNIAPKPVFETKELKQPPLPSEL